MSLAPRASVEFTKYIAGGTIPNLDAEATSFLLRLPNRSDAEIAPTSNVGWTINRDQGWPSLPPSQTRRTLERSGKDSSRESSTES